ncbi:hypothetical protein F5Y04DRAFT_257846 [Hypomontagnella monticulosa]|nr:hypothetical protein F5Y04DRAFT_257846 [Hypomontagnella monticulosa]
MQRLLRGSISTCADVSHKCSSSITEPCHRRRSYPSYDHRESILKAEVMDQGEGEENTTEPDQAPSRPQASGTSADDIRAIRIILSAVAKRFSIEIPKELVLSVNFDLLKLTSRSYNLDDVIKYQVGQLSIDNMLDPDNLHLLPYRLRQYIFRNPPTFTLNPPRPPREAAYSLVFYRLPMHLYETLREGLNRITIWPNCRRLVEMKEYGYDRDGYIYRLRDDETGDDINEYIFWTSQHQDEFPWKNQRFGKDWRLHLTGVEDEMSNISKLSLAFLQFRDEVGRNRTRSSLASDFIRGFWYEWTRNPNEATEHIHGMDIMLQYHARSFVTRITNYTKHNSWRRINGILNVPNDKRDLTITECRYSIGLKTTYNMDFPVFSVVTLSENWPYVNEDDLDKPKNWIEANIQPYGRSIGVAAFALRIYSFLKFWKDDWTQLLDDIDNALNSDLQNILSHERLREIMFDKPELRLSEFYFAVLQILRIAYDWIKGSMDDLRRLVDFMEDKYYSPDRGLWTFLSESPDKQELEIQMFKQNWGSVLSRQQDIGGVLLDRISKKQEEVKSLRDGLFSATSVNESTKSSQLNHYILVFTVVTIFYLPLSFVTALFALDMVKNQPNQVLAFTVTMALVAVSTYFLAGTLVWAVRKPERRDKFKQAYRNNLGLFRNGSGSV